jgi:hypothetical protein
MQHMLEWHILLEGKLIIKFRALYQVFYRKKGGALNKLRMFGALTCLLGVLANTIIFGTNFYKNWVK